MESAQLFTSDYHANRHTRTQRGFSGWAVLVWTLLLLPLAMASASGQTVATANLGANQVTLQITSGAAGLGSLTVLEGANAICGTTPQTAAGEDSTGAPAYRIGSLTLTAGIAGNYTVRNLAQSQAYTVCLSVAGGTPVNASFTTAAETNVSSYGWATVGPAAFSAGPASNDSLAFAPDGAPYVAYGDSANGFKVTVMKFDGTNWITVGAAGFSAGGADEGEAIAFAPDGTPYVAFEDGTDNDEMTVMKFDGTHWVTVGVAAFTPGGALIGSLAIAPDGTPYVAYLDETNRFEATVMKFDGTSWVTVGAGAFSGWANRDSLAIAPNGAPYVAYADSANNDAVTVVKFDGSTWVTVGAADFSGGPVNNESLAFAPDGTLHVAYVSFNTGLATVMKFDGTSWIMVGAAGFGEGPAAQGNKFLAFAADGTPYVAGWDGTMKQMATVMKFDGTNWVTVGSPSFSAGAAGNESLAFAPDGTPYLAYQDYGNNLAATVMKLGPVTTATTATATNITATGATLNGTVNDGGLATTVGFDYGTTTSYGTNVSATTGESIAAGSGATAALVNISSLSPNTTYHFRVDATTISGTVNGSDMTFTTDEAAPTIGTLPTASTITYGQTLASSTLTGGTASVPGTFSWTTSSTVPAAGTASYSVTFTPTDNNDYTTVTVTVTVTVNKSTATVALGSLTQTYTGSPLVATAITNPVGLTVNFTYNGSSTAPMTAGSYVVEAAINDASYSGSATGTMVIGKAASSSGVTSNSNPALLQNAVTLTATVSSVAGTPTGTVTFLDGTAPLGTGTVSGGLATLITSALTAGTHSISAAYGGDTNFVAAGSGTLTQSVLDFSLTAGSGSGSSGTAQTVASGGTATYAIALLPSAGTTLPAPVTLTVSGMPTGATATITPSSWIQLTSTSWSFPANTPPAEISLGIQLPTTTASLNGKDLPSRKLRLAFLGLLLLPFAGRMRRTGRKLGGMLSVLLLIAGMTAMAGLSGCGSGTGFFTQTQKTYTMTATATSGTLSHSTTITLTVK